MAGTSQRACGPITGKEQGISGKSGPFPARLFQSFPFNIN
jgi:hypothetical protein